MNKLLLPHAFASGDPIVPDAIKGMKCDGASVVLIGCQKAVRWGLRIHVPSVTQYAPGHDQVRATFPLHACDDHKEAGCFKLEKILVDKVKADIEAYAKKTRPIDWKPDFDAAFIQYVDVFSDEYKKFIALMNRETIAKVREIWGPIV